MSRSPSTKATGSDILAYDKGWAAVNRLIRAGKSFSGREENCLFLNFGDRRFATVSSALETNLPDDGRGLALTDWDGDGRVDFWMTNRTGPRVRFLKNEYSTDSDYLALQLQGTSTNRDAIGARAAVYLAGQERPLIKTIYGGSGYLSQSSKTLHFGLGPEAKIVRIVVRWPGGEDETFPGPNPNQRYLLVQGSGQVKENPVTRLGPWKAHRAKEPSLPLTSRVVLLEPATMPRELLARSSDGQVTSIVKQTPGARGLVINLWATWCANCMKELDAWSAQESQFRDAGLDVLTICVDEPTDDLEADQQRIQAVTSQLKLPFQSAISEPGVIEVLNVFQRAFIGRQDDLPLPSSFLLDAQGRLAVIYKGPVDAKQIISDSRVLGASRDQIFELAVPFAGKWLEKPPSTTSRMAAVALVENGYLEDAEKYVRQLLEAAQASAKPVDSSGSDTVEDAAANLSSLHHLLGALHFDKQRFAEASQEYRAALDLSPQQRGIREELTRTLVRLDRYEDAIEQMNVLLQERPEDAEMLAELGRMQAKRNHTPLALEAFQKSLAIEPKPDIRFEYANLLRDAGQYQRARQEYLTVMENVKSPVVMNNLAWMLATAGDDTARDGNEAVRLAEQASEATGRSVPRILGTLAASYAEAGRFDDAINAIQQAIEKAQQNEPDLVSELSQRQKEYQQHQPTRTSIGRTPNSSDPTSSIPPPGT